MTMPNATERLRSLNNREVSVGLGVPGALVLFPGCGQQSCPADARGSRRD